MINIEDYENKLEWPNPLNEEQEVETALSQLRAAEQRAAMILVEKRKAYYAESARLLAKFREDCFRELGVEQNPKREQAWRLAWDMRHSSGYAEVYSYFSKLVDLIKDGGPE